MHTHSTQLRRAGRSLGLLSVGVLSTLGALSLAHLAPAQAQSPGVNLAALVAEVNALKTQQVADDATIATLKGTPVPGPKGDTGPQGTPGLQGATGLTGPQGNLGNTGAAGAGFTPDKIAILGKLSLSGTDLTITGVNVHIVNGQKSTQTANGLGNLIIGYNATGNDQVSAGDIRTGSHNLILGDQNNYSSFGGLIAGFNNTISGPFASVSGGQNNTASGYLASVSGGYGNTASNHYASVSGGRSNTASGAYASVSGGQNNTASNFYASVSGGYGNTASSQFASVSGGENNTANGYASSVSGGDYNIASSEGSAVSGGSDNVANGFTASVSGGVNVTQSTEFGWSP
ncbi:MAG: hypothetical protein ACRYFS_17580 [Janthinobacterium lividum]